MKSIYIGLSVVVLTFLLGCGQFVNGQSTEQATVVAQGGDRIFQGEVWADNWFALYVGEELVQEDSVPITTERSFNAESFTFKASYPLQLNLVAKDFKENDTGLEYIGSRRQQMGDGGIIAQFTDVETGEVVAFTNKDWQCLVIHKAPLNSDCVEVSNPMPGEAPCESESREEPPGWKSLEYSDPQWTAATEHSARAVRPKDGYEKIDWNRSTKIIWSAGLVKDNTVLFRLTVPKPSE